MKQEYGIDLMIGGHLLSENTMIIYILVLVDGPFILKQKDMMKKFRGSANQRLINMKEYRKNGQISELILQ